MFLQELVAFVYWSREIWKNILAANNQGNSLNDRCSDSQFVFYPTLCCVFLVYEQISNCLNNFMKFALQRLKCIRTSNTCSTIEMIIFMIMNMQFETVFQWIAYYSSITQLHSYTVIQLPTEQTLFYWQFDAICYLLFNRESIFSLSSVVGVCWNFSEKMQ